MIRALYSFGVLLQLHNMKCISYTDFSFGFYINNISYYPEQARELHEAQALTSPSNEDTDGKGLDWNLAHEELMAKQGIDLKAEMAKKLKVSIVFGRHFLPVIFHILHKKKL